MKKEIQITPFEIKQAMIALELGPTDASIIRFLNYFSSIVPVAAMHFFHVLPGMDEIDWLIDRDDDSSWVALNEQVLGQLKKEVTDSFTGREETKLDFDIKMGNPLAELVRDAKRIKADLLVIGQKADTYRHGIMAKNLARSSPVNALVIPEKATPGITNILVPIDFSPHSIEAFHSALAINQRLPEPARITCLNVFEMPNVSAFKTSRTPEQFRKAIVRSRQQAFQVFLNTYTPPGKQDIQSALVEKEFPGIAYYIMEYAEENNVDFIVIGAKGHSRLELLLMGSVTEKLLSLNESIPALIVK